MARRSKTCAGAGKQVDVGFDFMGSSAGMRGQFHIPRRTRTIRPLRASAGSASPSMAERNLS